MIIPIFHIGAQVQSTIFVYLRNPIPVRIIVLVASLLSLWIYNGHRRPGRSPTLQNESNGFPLQNHIADRVPEARGGGGLFPRFDP
jgi:hypothetical protein